MRSRIVETAAFAAAFLYASAAFAEDAYVESDGTQYVNLGHCAGPNTKIELDFAFPEEVVTGNTDVRPLASLGSASNLQPCVRYYLGTKSGVQGRVHSFMVSTNNIGLVQETDTANSKNHTQGANLSVAADTGRHKIAFDFNYPNCTVSVATPDGEGGVTTDGSHTFTGIMDKTSTIPLGLFAENRSSTCIYSSKLTENTYSNTNGFWSPVKMRVYGLKIYEPVNGDRVLLKEFMPVVKGGVAGLLETNYVTGACHFHSSERYDALSGGGDIAEIPDDPYIWSPKNKLGVGPENNIYLDTGYMPGKDTRIELDYAMMTNLPPTGLSAGLYPYLLGAITRNQNATSLYAGFFTTNFNSGSMAYRIGYGKETAISNFDIRAAHNIRRTFSMRGNGFSVVTAGWTNFNETVSTPFAGTSFTMYHSLKIGANYGGNGRLLPMKIYGLRIYESDVLTKDYVPFVTNGVGGLKDVLNPSDMIFSKTMTQFRTNGSSGDYIASNGIQTNVLFDVGGNITCADGSDHAYLEFPGVSKCAVNSGYTVTRNTCLEIDFSFWNTVSDAEGKFIFEQRHATGAYDGVWTRLYLRNGGYLTYCFGDNPGSSTPSGWFTQLGSETSQLISNTRYQATLDGHDNRVVVTSGGATLFDEAMAGDRTAATCSTNLWIGSNWSGLSNASKMRLYGLRIYDYVDDVKTLARNYAPCVHNGQAGLYETVTTNFIPLAGGKVCGRTLQGETFQIAPAPAKIIAATGYNVATLTCVAAGAQSFEWYRYDEGGDEWVLQGESSDTLTVTWENMPAPYLVYFKARPVYTVFNETVKAADADMAETTVMMSRNGLISVFK